MCWFLKEKPRTETWENGYIIVMVSGEPRQIISVAASCEKASSTTRKRADASPGARCDDTDGYSGDADVAYPGAHGSNARDQSDIWTVEGVNADIQHDMPTLARRSRCFPRRLENLNAVLAGFARAYNDWGLHRIRDQALPSRSHHPLIPL